MALPYFFKKHMANYIVTIEKHFFFLYRPQVKIDRVDIKMNFESYACAE